LLLPMSREEPVFFRKWGDLLGEVGVSHGG